MTQLADLKKTYVVFLTDTDPDTGFVEQMKPVAYTETEGMAKAITEFLNKDDDSPNRNYSFTNL